MALTMITGPALEPVSLSEAKSHLRVDITDDDALIGGLITAVRELYEQELNQALVTQTWELVMDAFPAGGIIRLPKPPLQTVTSIKYTDKDGAEATFSSSNYLVDTDRKPGCIVLKHSASWPAVELREVGGVRVRYVAGYGSNAGDVPRRFKQKMLLYVGTLYENREYVLVAQGVSVMALPWVKAMNFGDRVLRV